MLLSTIKGHASLSESTIARSEGFCCGSQIDHFIQTADFRGFVVGALIAVFFGFAAGAQSKLPKLQNRRLTLTRPVLPRPIRIPAIG
jgi:hypothetical protein